MAAKGPLRGISQYVIHRLVANYWSLPLIAVFGAPLLGAAVLWTDRAFAGDWLFEQQIEMLKMVSFLILFQRVILTNGTSLNICCQADFQAIL